MRKIDEILKLMEPSLSKANYKLLEHVLETVLEPAHVNKSNEEVIKCYLNHCRYLEKTEATITRVEIALLDLSKNLRTSIIDADTHALLAYFRDYKNKRKVKARTLNTVMAYVNGLYRYLVYEDWISYNPMTKIEKIREPKIIQPNFTEEEVKDLREAMMDNPRDRAIFEFLLATGCRKSELTCLKIEDINFDNQTVFIEQGKGRKDRIVYFNNYALKYLLKYLKCRKNKDPESYLFTLIRINKDGKISYSEKPLGKCGINYIFDKYGKIAGVQDCHAHKCRHYCISKLIRRGMRPELVAKQAGHSSVSTTLDIYTNVDPIDVETEYKKAMIV